MCYRTDLALSQGIQHCVHDTGALETANENTQGYHYDIVDTSISSKFKNPQK